MSTMESYEWMRGLRCSLMRVLVGRRRLRKVLGGKGVWCCDQGAVLWEAMNLGTGEAQCEEGVA